MRYPSLFWVAPTTVGAALLFQDNAVQLETAQIGIDVSPQCQQNALQVVDDGQFGHALSEHYCQLLSYSQKQLLALELTKCHLDEMQQSTFETPCTLSVHDCLARLTPLGFQSYTMFKINIEQYCVKLNHELMMLQQQKMSLQLKHTAQQVTQQFSDLMMQHGNIKEEYSQLFLALSKEQADLHTNLIEQATQVQRFSEQQVQAWTKQMLMLQEQQMQSQLDEVADFSNAINNALSKIKNALHMELILFWISSGIRVAYLLAYMIVSFQIQWILTLPRRVRSCRRMLRSVAFVEFMLISTLVCFDDDKARITGQRAELLRFFSCTVQIAIFSVSLLRSFFRHDPVVGGDMKSPTIVTSLERMMESINMVEAELVNCEKRLRQLVAAPQNQKIPHQLIIDSIRADWDIREERLVQRLSVRLPKPIEPPPTIGQVMTLSSQRLGYNIDANENSFNDDIRGQERQTGARCGDFSHCNSSCSVFRGHMEQCEQSRVHNRTLPKVCAAESKPVPMLPLQRFDAAQVSPIAIPPSLHRNKHDRALHGFVGKKHGLSDEMKKNEFRCKKKPRVASANP